MHGRHVAAERPKLAVLVANLRNFIVTRPGPGFNDLTAEIDSPTFVAKRIPSSPATNGRAAGPSTFHAAASCMLRHVPTKVRNAFSPMWLRNAGPGAAEMARPITPVVREALHGLPQKERSGSGRD